MLRSRKYSFQSGQALVLVLLSLAVVLTIVLFILARSVTDIAVSSRSEEAVRAFSAAEAGIEQALVIGTGATDVTIGDAKFTSQVIGFAERLPEYEYPFKLNSGDTMFAWFIAHKGDGSLGCDATHPCFAGDSLKVCWGDGVLTGSESPAIEVSLFYDPTSDENFSDVKIARGAYDEQAASRSPVNSFEAPDTTNSTCTIAGKTYKYGKTISFSSLGIPLTAGKTVAKELLFGRIRMLYNTTQGQPVAIGVSGGTLPSQGQDITSTGKAGDSNRKVKVFQAWPEPPSVFDYSIYSGSGLIKN